jgi:MBG domain (YGX type)
MLKKTLILIALLTGLGTTSFAQTFIFLPPTLSDGQYGSAYNSQTLTVIGGFPPYTFSVTAGSLPPGMSLSNAGTLSGTPTAAGAYSFTVTATDNTPPPLGPFSGSQTYSLNIDPAPLTITAANASMTYGGTVPSLSVSYSGFVNGDGASSLTTTPTVSTTATSSSPADTYPITATGAVDPNYSFTYHAGTMTVGKAILTVTADNKTMPLGGPVPDLTVSYMGFVNGDGASSLTTQPTATTTATATSPTGSYTITPHGGSSTNYTFSYVAGILSVGQAVLTITANPAGSVYGAALVPKASLTVSYSGFVNGDGPSSMTVAPTVSNSAVSGDAAGSYTLTPSGAVNPNYIIQYVSGVYTISPAALTITAANASMTYGGTVPSLSVSYTGFVNGDGASSLTTAPTITTTGTSSSPAGPYPITPAGAIDPNYTITYHTGTMTIGKATLTASADNKAMPLGGPLPTLTISYTGFLNGDNASSLTTQPTATTTATATSPAGSYPITLHGGSSPNYTLSYVTGILSVGQAVLTITANPAGSVYGAALVPKGSLTVTYSGFVNGDGPSSMTVQPTVINTAFTGAPAGAYTLIPSGAVDPNYVIQYVNGSYTISPAPLTITADNASMTYGGTLPSPSVSYTGFVNGDRASSLTTPPTITTTATSASPAGDYPITASGAVDPNYNITYNPGTLSIGPGSLVVKANAQTKEYGAPDPTLTYTASGFVNGDNSGIFTGSLSRTAGENVGTYPITEGTLSAGGNYTIHFTGNYLTITVASQKITWTQSLVVGCNTTTQVIMNATDSSGLPVTYSVADPEIARVSGDTLTLLQPGTTVVTAKQAGDANHTAAQPVTDTVFYQSSSLITEHWDDVIFFDNSGGDYVTWQWYKNDSAVAGATSPYYSETPSLNGQYFVIATNTAGQQVQSCTLTIAAGAPIPGGIKAYPNPVNIGQLVTVTSNYSNTALQGAILQIVDITGRVLQQITSVQPSMQVTMPSGGGLYIINLLLANGAKATVNVLVVN